MHPDVIIYGFLLFFSCLIVHIIIWRIRISVISSLVLILIFLLPPMVILLFVAAGREYFENTLLSSSIEIAEVVVLHLALSFAYISSYPAVRAVSPSLDIVLMIASSKEKKMSGEDLEKKFFNKRLVTARIDDLKIYRLVEEKDGRFELSPFAIGIVKLFIGYRKLLGLPMGKG